MAFQQPIQHRARLLPTVISLVPKAIMPPLVFEPHYWNRLWGGRSLETRFARRIPDGLVGESWEISTHALHVSRVAEGPFVGKSLAELWMTHRAELLGTDAAALHDKFPLLIKLLDCQQPLSVQVHPAAEQAARLCPQEGGKSEAWIVLDAGPNASLLAGFQPGMTSDQLLAALQAGRVNECLHQLYPQVGDCILIPPGVPHALLGPLVLLEVQPTSDATFRLFDWNRVDLSGQPRQLHIAESLACIDWTYGPIRPAISQPLAISGSATSITATRLLQSPEFTIDRYWGTGAFDVAYPSLSAWLLVKGRARLQDAQDFSREFVAGETVLVPTHHARCHWQLSESSELIALLP